MGIKIAAGSIVLLLMVASFALYSSVESRGALAESVGLASEAIAESLSSSIDKMIYMRAHEVHTTMGDSRIVAATNDSNAAYDAMEDPEAYIDLIDDEWISAAPDEIPESMAEILENDISVHLRSELIEHYVSAHGMEVFGEVILTNKYGAVVAATGRVSDFRQNDEPWWVSTKTGEFTITDVCLDYSSGIYGVCACIPVQDSAGEIIGVAKAVVNILTVAKDIELTALGYETSELKIVTPAGMLVFSSRAYSIFQNVSGEAFFEHATEAKGHFSEKEGDTDRLFSYATATGYLEYKGYGWIVFLSHAEAEVLGPAIDLQLRILLVAGLTVAAAAVFALYISRLIARPLAELETATRSMAKGDLSRRIGVDRSDEFGQLADSFNYMASELESLYSDLDQRVKERTEELENVNQRLGVLASITRHDAMNQMTVQRGLLYMARESSKDPATNDYLRKLEVLTDNLVSFFRFTSEYEEVGINKPEWVNVEHAFKSAIIGLDLTGKRLDIKLEGIEVFVDPMFPKVLHNLVSNSLKHGQKSTSISMSYYEDSNGLTIVMEDDGVGVPNESKETIFQRESVTGRRAHGLFLSAEILRITKIAIRETGVPGKGARFEMTVPKRGYRSSGAPTEGPPPEG